jgi:hypothetical protein
MNVCKATLYMALMLEPSGDGYNLKSIHEQLGEFRVLSLKAYGLA